MSSVGLHTAPKMDTKKTHIQKENIELRAQSMISILIPIHAQ
jgi:hypothetical protein